MGFERVGFKVDKRESRKKRIIGISDNVIAGLIIFALTSVSTALFIWIVGNNGETHESVATVAPAQDPQYDIIYSPSTGQAQEDDDLYEELDLIPALIWGPMDRPTFTLDRPASYIVFNSMLDNPAVFNDSGDERDFVLVSESRNSDDLTNELAVVDGQEVYVVAFVHNNQNPDFNAVTGPAQNVHISFDISGESILSDGRNVMPVIGFISSVSANPRSVWATAILTAEQPFRISYVENSALWAYDHVNGMRFVREITNPTVGNGANLGDIYGGVDFHGLATFRVSVEFDE